MTATTASGSSGEGSALERSRAPVEAMGQVSVAKLREVIRPIMMVSNKKKSIRNWGGTFVCQPSRIFSPTTVEQCCAIVELARRIGGIEVRAIGRSHSPGDIVFTKDWIIRMDGVKGLIEVDSSQPSITVLAGTFVSDIHAMLEASIPPLSMTNVGSISEQTIGGLISTATHGTGIKEPVISTAVHSLKVVCPLSSEQGGTKVLRCSRTENVELFNASLCGLGATGLIVEVTMQVDHLFKLKQISEECSFDFVFGKRTDAPKMKVSLLNNNIMEGDATAKTIPESIGKRLAHRHWLSPAQDCYRPTTRISDPSLIYPVPLDTAISRTNDEEDDETTRTAQERLETIIASSQFVRILWFPTVSKCTVMRANRTLEPFQTPGLFARWHHQVVGYRLTELLLYLSRFHSSLPPRVNRTIHRMTAPASLPSPAAVARKKQKTTENSNEPSHSVQLGSISEVEALDSHSSPSSASTPNSHLVNLEAFGSGGDFKPLELATTSDTCDPEPLDPSHTTITLVDTSHRVFNVDCLFPQYTNEWAIPLGQAASAIRAMRDWLEEEESLQDGERIHFPVEIRFADGDGIWMSHCQGRKTCFIGLTKYRPFDKSVPYRKLFSKFENLMRHYAGRPHWAKAHSCGPMELQQLYPHLPDYLNLIRKVDPKGLFRNPYIRRHLLGQISEDASPRVFKSRL